VIVQSYTADTRSFGERVTRSSETNIEMGYPANVIGFGWSNDAFLTLLDELTGKAVTGAE
jgi:hypothetical protein